MALFDALFSQPTQEERERKQREAYLDLLRGKQAPAGPPEPTLGDIAGREQFVPPPEPRKLGMADSLAAAGEFGGFTPGVAGQGRQLPQAPDIPIPQIDIDQRPFGDTSTPPAVPPPARAGGLPRAAGRGGGAPGVAAPAGGAAVPPAGVVPPAAPGPAPGSPEARILELERLRDEAMKPPDMKAAQEAYGKQADEGRQQLVLSMLANEAKLQPFSAHHLKQSAAAREPMKMVGGTMTGTGFIEDPGFKQQQTVTRLEGQIGQQQKIQASNAARADKIEAAEKERQFKRELNEANNALRRDLAASRGDGKGKGKGGKGGDTDPVEINRLLDEAERLLPGATSGVVQRMGSELAAGAGISTSGARATAALDTIAGQLTMNMPRMEGPQSDKDAALYERMAGRLSDPNVPVATRQAALAQIRRLNQNYASGYYAGDAGKGGGRRASDQGGGELDYSALPRRGQ